MNMKPAPLALAFGLALAGAAVAQTAPTPAQQKELDAARSALDQAAQRYAELARKYDQPGGPIRIERRMLRKPVIGVLLAPDETAGVRIAGVTPDSAAAAAGLKSGDRITGIDGKPIDAESAAARVERTRELLGAGDTKTPVKLTFERDGKARTISVTPKLDQRVFMLNGADGSLSKLGGNVFIRHGDGGAMDVEADSIEFEPGDLPLPPPGIAPEVRREIVRLGRDCKGKDCKLPAFAEAFRWNGLNLATVDAQLGRYFGASDGVLVLSTGKELDGLQAGDVIRKIGGKPVATPREAMDALRAQPAGDKVAIDYLRDRVAGTAQVSVPKAPAFDIMMAPRAPMPPMLPRSPMPPDAAGMHEKRRFVVIDKDGKRQEWEGDAGDTPPAWVQALPKDGKRVERRVQVIVDDKGNKTVIEGDDLPPPPPPPPAPPKVD